MKSVEFGRCTVMVVIRLSFGKIWSMGKFDIRREQMGEMGKHHLNNETVSIGNVKVGLDRTVKNQVEVEECRERLNQFA